VIDPWVDAVNVNYKTIIAGNAGFQFGGVNFNAQGAQVGAQAGMQ
jgi:hypothetical protein